MKSLKTTWRGMKNETHRINGSFSHVLSEFIKDSLKAEVWKTIEGHYGVRFWKNQVWQKDEVYQGHSEVYAESAAENYVFGIKEI